MDGDGKAAAYHLAPFAMRRCRQPDEGLTSPICGAQNTVPYAGVIALYEPP